MAVFAVGSGKKIARDEVPVPGGSFV